MRDAGWQIRLGVQGKWACALGLLLLAGCASPGPGLSEADPKPTETTRGGFAGNQGGAWEVLFTPTLDREAAGVESHRRDVAMNIREPQPITQLGMWPEAPRPRLGQTRRLFLPRRADDVLIFREGPPPFYHRTWWAWH